MAFVTGHEVGHLTSNDSGTLDEISEWVTSTYERNETEPGRFNEAQHVRFLKPESVQKFDADGSFAGDIILGIKFRDRWDHLKSLQIGEAFSDVLGLVALTKVAIDSNIEADTAASTVLELLEFTEMLMSLKRILPRLPIRGAATNVPYESTSLGFRRFMFVEVIKAMRKRLLPVPEVISAYWDSMSEVGIKDLNEKTNQVIYTVFRTVLCISLCAQCASASYGSLQLRPKLASQSSKRSTRTAQCA